MPPPEPKNTLIAPLQANGALRSLYKHQDSTVVIGTEFPAGSVQLSSLLNAPNSDEIIEDLASLISERGVVFFRAQKLEIEEQREFVKRLGNASGRPPTSGLHVHPLAVQSGNLGDDVSVLSSDFRNKVGIGGGSVKETTLWDPNEKSTFAAKGWHSDVSYEKVPADYAVLRFHTIPETGGDTLWLSTHEMYNRLSKPFQRFLEGLEAVHDASHYISVARKNGFEIKQNRGSPENSGLELTSVHPVIRTNPVTRRKSVYVNPMFTKRILGVTKDESDDFLAYLYNIASKNHDLQVRHKWGTYPETPGVCDVAMWDNRCTMHCGTEDYHNLPNMTRSGERLMGVGEKPYLDPSNGN